MGAPRYSEAAKQKALGALMASAVEKGGEMVPNFRAVARTLDMPRRTLQRWWKSRERAQDAPLRAMVTRPREEVVAEGAASFYKTAIEALKRQVTYVAAPIHYDTSIYTDESGREHTRGARLDQVARAMEITLRSLETLQQLEKGDEAAGATPAQRAAAAMRRTKLLKTLDNNQRRNRDLGDPKAAK